MKIKNIHKAYHLIEATHEEGLAIRCSHGGIVKRHRKVRRLLPAGPWGHSTRNMLAWLAAKAETFPVKHVWLLVPATERQFAAKVKAHVVIDGKGHLGHHPKGDQYVGPGIHNFWNFDTHPSYYWSSFASKLQQNCKIATLLQF